MATLQVDVGPVPISVAQTGSGPSTNVADRGARSGGADLEIVTTVGATPTCTYLIEGSMDGVNFYPVPSADPATPTTFAQTTFVITTATTTRRFLQPGIPWRYLRVTMSANTNVTSTISVWFY